jgi:hypothetical protein
VNLPSELTEGAELRGNEYAWSPSAFPSILAKAKSLGFGCLGGQFQFRAPGATCEMYWLNPDPDPRAPDEDWSEFSARSCDQVLVRFQELLNSTDFAAEGKRWSNVPALSGPEAEPLQHLCIVAYFIQDKAGV